MPSVVLAGTRGTVHSDFGPHRRSDRDALGFTYYPTFPVPRFPEAPEKEKARVRAALCHFYDADALGWFDND